MTNDDLKRKRLALRLLEDVFHSVNDKPPQQIKYPVYILSKARSDIKGIANVFKDDGVPFRVIVEPQDAPDYEKVFAPEQLLVLRYDNKGISYVRNFAKQYSASQGFDSHWQFDDNIRGFVERFSGKPNRMNASKAIRVIEGVYSHFQNIGGIGLANSAFVFSYDHKEPIVLNTQIYCGMLLNNRTIPSFRAGVVEDTDYSLQLLTEGWVTMSVKRISIVKPASASMKGGLNVTEYTGTGRTERFQRLVSYWPDRFRLSTHSDGKARAVPTNAYRGFRQLPMVIKN